MNSANDLERGEIFNGGSSPTKNSPTLPYPPPQFSRDNNLTNQRGNNKYLYDNTRKLNYQATSSAVNIPEPSNKQQPGTSAGSANSAHKIQTLQNTVDEVSQVLQSNINKVLDRGSRIDTINERSELLNSRANEFRINSRTVRRKFWWQNLRFTLVLALVVITVLALLICKYHSVV